METSFRGPQLPTSLLRRRTRAPRSRRPRRLGHADRARRGHAGGRARAEPRGTAPGGSGRSRSITQYNTRQYNTT